MSEYRIDILWDAEAAVWIATSADLPGLVLESGSLDALVERVRFAVPDLLDVEPLDHQPIRLVIRSERHELVAA